MRLMPELVDRLQQWFDDTLCWALDKALDGVDWYIEKRKQREWSKDEGNQGSP